MKICYSVVALLVLVTLFVEFASTQDAGTRNKGDDQYCNKYLAKGCKTCSTPKICKHNEYCIMEHVDCKKGPCCCCKPKCIKKKHDKGHSY